MNMSFISRASPHEVLSFLTQRIHPSAKDWLTMDVIQSAIMTSSLINLTLANPAYSLAHTLTCTHTHAHWDNRVGYQQVLFLSLWDHGNVFCHSNSVTLGKAVLVDLLSRVKYLSSYWMDYHESWYTQSWVREDYQQDVLSKMHSIFTAVASLDTIRLLVSLWLETFLYFFFI